MADICNRRAAAPAVNADSGGARRPFPIRRVVEIAVAAAFDVTIAELHRPTRGTARTALARQIAMYVAHVALGFSYREAGNMFGRDRTTAAHACRIVEELREDPRTDAQVQALEQACSGLRERNTAPHVLQ
jgi:chromosomal replication initiation ATPase DnaA